MFVAYLMPLQDVHLAMEDGVGFLEIGATREEAEAKLRRAYDEAMPDGDEEEFPFDKCVAWEEHEEEDDPAYRMFIVEA